MAWFTALQKGPYTFTTIIVELLSLISLNIVENNNYREQINYASLQGTGCEKCLYGQLELNQK